jgi:hypothetical protein
MAALTQAYLDWEQKTKQEGLWNKGNDLWLKACSATDLVN